MKLKETYDADAIHDRWESIYRGDPRQDRLNDRIMDRFIGLIKPPPGALFLDAGCGIGDHSIRIARRGFQCVGADISESILRKARENVENAGVESKVSLTCQALEELAFAEGQFDVVHCRGVLMHVPQWEKAITELCRVLKPGGKIVIMELNHTSLEMTLVRLARRFRKGGSTLKKTRGGLEFWSVENGNPFVVRAAHVDNLVRELAINRAGKVHRYATEFWDINRFPAGVLRHGAIRFNQFWFSLHLPAYPSSGNGLIAEMADRKLNPPHLETNTRTR